MKMHSFRWVAFVVLAMMAAAFLWTGQAWACSRAVYLGLDGNVVTVRSMDWPTDLGTNLWILPRGMAREGAAGPGSAKWTAKYGSVVASAFEAATADGMNEKGLAANILYLTEADYPKAPESKARPVSISVWAQYVLDNYATVAEAVAELKKEPIRPVAVMTPDGVAGSMHLAISDPTGDSAIIEYIGGKLVVHHGREFQVMTNSPAYDKQLALVAYWQEIGGKTMLPGTNRAEDRFVRASYYIKAVKQTADNREAVAAAFSVIRNVSAPWVEGSRPGQPYASSTIWRVAADHKSKRYFFEHALNPSLVWVDLPATDFSAGAQVKKLTLTGGAMYSGNAAAAFKPAEAFKFLPAVSK